MKFLKYVIFSLLIITAYKTILPKNAFYAEKQKKKSLSSNVSKYDEDKKTATVSKTVFIGIHEHDTSKSIFSPSQKVPAMVPFGTIDSKEQSSTNKFDSRFKKSLSLYGIPVDVPRKPIRKLHTNKAVGYIWQDQDRIKEQDYGLGIAQMHNGTTYVGLKAVHIPNYIENHNSPHYNDDEKELLQQRYGITKIDNAKILGTSKLGSMRYSAPYKRQNYIVYGVRLPDVQELTKKNNDLASKEKLTAHSIIAYQAIQKYLTQQQKNNPENSYAPTKTIPSRTAAYALFNPAL